MRRLIVNADDFGHGAAVNAGVIECFEQGIVTSTSLMVRRPGVLEAAAYARSQASFDVGLHVELGEWVFANGDWSSTGEVAAGDVEVEARAQLASFHDLVGRGPTHLDSHQHVHCREPARSVLLSLASELEVPLRHFAETVRYCGDFYGQTDEGEPLPEAVGVERLLDLIRELPHGLTELCCHPARGAVAGSSYAAERNRELEALCDPRVRLALDQAGIVLCTFAEAA